MQIKIINKSKHPLPKYSTAYSAGMDLRANINEEISLLPQDRVLVKTGLHLEIPQGYEAQVRPRSGLALKNGITVLNSPGTIDADYRGEVGVVLINHSKDVFYINNGDRIAQLVFAKHEQATLVRVSVLDESERSEGGFGSTGKK
tara:strand:+ start:2080 stop:2514 length:435 start_codon:yes stop_codon:yes gene_type:complete